MTGFDEQKQRAIIMLAAGSTQVEVAKECNVVDRTVRRWIAEPEFAAAVDAQREAMTKAVDARLRSLGGRAIETLGDVMAHGEDKDRIAAARVILDRVAPATQKHEVSATQMSTEEIEAKMRELGFVRKEGA